MARVLASEATRKRIEAMINGQSEGIDKSELVRAAARLIVEEALEEEVSDALGREFYQHGAKPGSGYRSGYRSGRIKSAEGAIEYEVPQVADRSEPFRSKRHGGVRLGALARALAASIACCCRSDVYSVPSIARKPAWVLDFALEIHRQPEDRPDGKSPPGTQRNVFTVRLKGIQANVDL